MIDTLFRALLKRDDYKCLCCNSENELQPAHYKARSQAGSDELDNLMLLCFRCHRAQHDGKLKIKKLSGRFFFKWVG